MATVAQQLRTGREASGLTVHQVAETTKMRTDHVRALEEGSYDAFIAPVYIRGFVRTYARLLKLDEAAVLRTLDQELAQTEKFREHPSLMGQQTTPLDLLMLQLSRINWRIVLPTVGLLAVVAISIVVARNLQQNRATDPLEGVSPGVYEAAQPSPGDTLPLPGQTAPRRAGAL